MEQELQLQLLDLLYPCIPSKVAFANVSGTASSLLPGEDVEIPELNFGKRCPIFQALVVFCFGFIVFFSLKI